MDYQTLLVETHGRVGLITLNRPQALNALNSALLGEVNQALDAFEADHNIGCIVITGSEKVSGRRKPMIAAVAGFALGGGCEFAMMCDFIIAADNARFGQPEIKLGVMPGMGGTQRLTRLIGKAKAMEMCLMGRMMGAEEAERSGLVARVVPLADLLPETMKTADTIASMSLPIAMMTKETISRADEVSLSEGIRFERRLFHAMFATADQKEGMVAFVEKRAPQFNDQRGQSS
jgi:enoyl-CoA hydratase